MLNRTPALLGSVLLAVLVLTAACADSPVAPSQLGDHLVSPAASPTAEQHVDLMPLGLLGNSDIDGEAWLTRTKDGIWLELEAFGDAIEPMDAFTIWAVIFNNPEGCLDGCGADDLFRASAGAMVLNFGGGVDEDGDAELETSEMEAHLERGSTEGKQVLVSPDFPPGRSMGVKNPWKVEVHVILRNHGLKENNPDDLDDQTSMVGAFCNLPDARDTDTPGPPPVFDGCADQGIAVFGPVTAPGQGG